MAKDKTKQDEIKLSSEPKGESESVDFKETVQGESGATTAGTQTVIRN